MTARELLTGYAKTLRGRFNDVTSTLKISTPNLQLSRLDHKGNISWLIVYKAGKRIKMIETWDKVYAYAFCYSRL